VQVKEDPTGVRRIENDVDRLAPRGGGGVADARATSTRVGQCEAVVISFGIVVMSIVTGTGEGHREVL
jgi:hypothetical protein